ncbi:MAG: hypothetical protein AVDCRST_MAG26-1475 [uncultured Chloroflexia bacterium]|uniref:Uncharacterized protein n=1 Tax=uncultured Chloroflexia bacterium TaxID=1672391 RepID=A0A6J4I5K3_9CHLR|nr:MAG: hypothetical protein AVDCRST_MAG26-1475 [uncultured Chloroflexia bacterium]
MPFSRKGEEMGGFGGSSGWFEYIASRLLRRHCLPLCPGCIPRRVVEICPHASHRTLIFILVDRLP